MVIPGQQGRAAQFPRVQHAADEATTEGLAEAKRVRVSEGESPREPSLRAAVMLGDLRSQKATQLVSWELSHQVRGASSP